MGLNTNASCHEVLLQNEQWFRRPEDGYARRKGGGQHSVTNDQGVWLVFLLAPEDCSSVSTFKGVCSILEESRPLLFLLENVDGMETKSAKDSEEVPSAVPVGLSWKLKLDWIWIVFFSECFVLSLRRSQFCHGNSSILTFAPRLMTHDSENDFSHPVYGFRQVETVAKSFFFRLSKHNMCCNTTHLRWTEQQTPLRKLTCQAARSLCKVQYGIGLAVPPIPAVLCHLVPHLDL